MGTWEILNILAEWTETDRNRQKGTEIDTKTDRNRQNGQKQTDMDKIGQKQTKIDKTEGTDRN